ncbi:MAG: conserved phage C-terminal domain-containing protein [Terrisporobacter sp.]|uniref:conserved phage C-terminal domain-containing protein n=1 Tax=Terrisporobacter sp. TaxID=1965305 RepID=UPI002A90FD47|nr:conserved phage C-terminal domain-containing protein [Terrisporobacter sp.]MDY6152780.1 conserved phage C-terminal domain-containing protein [Terrisporobacter sp.]
MKKYFIALDEMTLEEIDIWRLLCRYSNYDTDVAGYTINQLVVNSDKRLNLTTQKVRTILKKFEKQGYIEFLSSGSKGKESTLKLTIKQQLFNNNATNKTEQLQQVEDLGNNNLTTNQQQSNNTTKKKEKDNNNIYSLVIDYLNRKASTNYRSTTKNTQGFINARLKEGYTVEDFKKVIDSKSKEWLNTDFEKYLRPATLFGTKFENYLNEANKKEPTAIGSDKNKNIKVNPSICNSGRKYTRGVEML